MYPYQLSRLLAEQRIHDMVAAAERHDRIATARRHRRNQTAGLSRVNGVTAPIRWMFAQLTSARSVGPHPTVKSMTDAGPMGCSV